MLYVEYKILKNFTYDVLKKIGCNENTSETVSLGLCETSLRGVDSHGIKLLPHYVESAKLGRKNPTPKFNINKKNCIFFSSNCWDIHGASNFGFQTVWVNRKKNIDELLPGKVDDQVQSLKEYFFKV